MNSVSTPIEPPAPKVRERELAGWRLFSEMRRSSIGFWPRRAFEDLVYVQRIFGSEVVMISDPEAARRVLVTPAKYKRPAAFFRVDRPWSGDGLVLDEGDEWRRQRKLLAPMFNPASVGQFLPHFRAGAETLIQSIDGSDRVNLSAAFQDSVLSALLQVTFSRSPLAERMSTADLIRQYLEGCGRPTLFDALSKDEHDFAFASRARTAFRKSRVASVTALIDARPEAGTLGGAPNLLDLLRAARDPLTDAPLEEAEVGDQVSNFLFSGYESTSRLLFWAAYVLALDEAEQARIRREVEAFRPDRVAGLDDLQNWPRLRQVLLETLRLYPVTAHIWRQAVEEDTACGTAIRPGADIWISPWVMHRHRKLWDRPTVFAPDRFDDRSSPWTSVAAFMPFGAGPRICIGAAFTMAEVQLILGTFISRFRFSLDSAAPVIPIGAFSLKPNSEPLFRVERIH